MRNKSETTEFILHATIELLNEVTEEKTLLCA